jgi:uncharacterized membrane protein
MNDKLIEGISKTGLFASLIFIGTFLFKIPMPFGYMHLGDCMIVLAVLMLGGRKSAVAGALGAGLADLISGYAIWFIPTVICKGIMALFMGYFISKGFFNLKGKALWLTGAIIGGMLQSIGYTITRIFFYGLPAALASFPLVLIQTGLGIIFALLISEALRKTALNKAFRV